MKLLIPTSLTITAAVVALAMTHTNSTVDDERGSPRDDKGALNANALQDKPEEISEKYGDDDCFGKSDSSDRETKQKRVFKSVSQKSGISESESLSESVEERKHRKKSAKSRRTSSNRKISRRKRKYSDSDGIVDIDTVSEYSDASNSSDDQMSSSKKRKRSSGFGC